MMEEGIQAGDVVTLKDGGPAMTVQARSQNLAYCAWMRDGQLQQGTFEIANLRRVVASGQPAREGGGGSEPSP
jgi:uncharacterized protein YodC (DUF2158 family)